ncbi:MAG: hypothetical protein JSV19_06010 [Phycisphaerales bacterium]|nr:MAG: hypothetical protein JSV19_06010 [Phycisphaerales bacterium]
MAQRVFRVVLACCALTAPALAADPPAPDALTESSASQWDWGLTVGGSSTITDDGSFLMVGTNSLKYETTGGFDTWLWTPVARDGDWDFTYVAALRFWVYAENPSPYNFQNQSPWIRLGTGPGTSDYYQYQAGYEVLNDAVGSWLEITIPIEGDVTWQRTQVGGPDLAHIDYVEIHADTWDSGFTLWFDGMTFDPVPDNPTGLAAMAGDSVVSLSWDPYIPRPWFDHFAIYRDTSPFSSVVGMTPLDTVTDPNATLYDDATAVNGTSYYYAITAVGSSGEEDTDVECVGPRTPWPKTDVQLTPYYSTAHVAWDEVVNPDVAGYEVYRRTPAQGYPDDPIKRVLVRTSFTDCNLTPGQTYYYKVYAIDGDGNEVNDFTNEQAVTLGTDPNEFSMHKNMELLMVFYKRGYTDTEVNQLTEGLKKGLEFYWRTSVGQLNMDVTWMYLDDFAPGPDWYSSAVQNELRSRGVENDQYDLAYLVGNNLAGCYGGYVVFGSTCASLGTVCGVPYPGKDPNVNYTIAWTFTHELHHALEAMENRTAGTPEVLFCHFPWAYPDPLGPTGWHMDWGAHYDGIGLTNREYGDDWLLYPWPYDSYIECVDDDGDDLPDDDPRVWMDEVRFGSSSALADTDGDGLDDLGEYTAYNFRGVDPLDTDTDDDGIVDGDDHQPLYSVSRYLPLMPTPGVDGVVGGWWNLLTEGYYFTNYVADFDLTTYAGYNEDGLYFAFVSSEKLRFMISIDGSGQDGRFESPVRHTAGHTDTSNPDNKHNHFGDSWGDGNHVYTYHGASTVEVYGRSVIPGAEVGSQYASWIYETEMTIPRTLPEGAAYTWYPSDAPVVDGLTLTPGHVIGINITFSNYYGSDGGEFSGMWTSLFETHSYVDFILQQRGDADCDGDVDLADFTIFQQCYTGDGGTMNPTCLDMDFDGDDDVDENDYAQFDAVLTGP